MRTLAIRSLPLVLAALLSAAGRARLAAADVPSSPFLPLVYRAAGAWLERDPPIRDALREENLLRLAYTLSGLSSKPVYRETADRELQRHLKSAAPMSTAVRSWLLWERSFQLAPQASLRHAEALATGLDGSRSPRELGFAVRAAAAAYRHTRGAAELRVLEDVVSLLERRDLARAATLSVAIDCDGSSRLAPEPLAARLRALATRVDEAFCALAHDLSGRGGFAAQSEPADPAAVAVYTSPWTATGVPATATLAMMCVSRYENTGKSVYRDLVVAAADAYGRAEPPAPGGAEPAVFGHAISLELAAWRSTARAVYLERARSLAEAAVKAFWRGESPVPELPGPAPPESPAEAAGFDSLALALVELHLDILHITAVDCPRNTADR